MNDNFIGTEFTTPRNGIITITGIKGKQSGIKLYECICNLCSNDVELFPNHFSTLKGNIKKGIFPCGCGKSPRWDSTQMEIITKRKCESNGYIFIGYESNIKISSVSKFKYICPTHGINEQNYNNFVNGNKGCRSCSEEKLSSLFRLKDSENIVKNTCSYEGYQYHGFISGYKNKNSKFLYSCPIHGICSMSYNNFVNHGARCSGCAKTGYDKTKPGYFYVFLYQHVNEDPVYKFGITNRKPIIRSNEHLKGIPNKNILKRDKIISLYFKDGNVPYNIERFIIKNYKTGVCNWLTSGNTETTTIDVYSNIDIKGIIEGIYNS